MALWQPIAGCLYPLTRCVSVINHFNCYKMVTIDGLVGMTCASERALRRGFQRYFGLPPCQYRQLRRLHQARRLLRDGHPQEVNVTGIAAQLGMWDFGRFAQRYRHLFGERPSDTLCRSKRLFQVGLNNRTSPAGAIHTPQAPVSTHADF